MKLGRLKRNTIAISICLFPTLSLTAIDSLAVTLYVDKNNQECATTTDDNLYCEIQDAINNAGDADVIYIATGTYSNIQIPPSSAINGPNKNRHLTIKGSGVNKTIIKGGFQRALNIRENITISDLAIRDSQPTKAGGGGGVYISNEIDEPTPFAVNVLLENVKIENNWAGFGGGIATRLTGNANNELTVTLTNSVVLNNTSQTNHTVPSHRYPSPGGGIYVDSGVTFNILNSTVAYNSAIPGISAVVPGGGYAGGIFNIGTTNIVNSTIYSNESQATEDGGGAIRNGLDTNAGFLNLYNVTISNNSAVNAYGAIHNDFGSITVNNSIIAGNTDNNIAPNCGGAGQFISSGFNIIGDLTGCSNTFPVNRIGDQLQADFNQIGLNPLPFIDEPGYGESMFMAQAIVPSNSIAIDMGSNEQTGCSGPSTTLTTDQRGIQRPFDGDNNGSTTCDVGAYEIAPGVLISPSGSLLTFENQGTATLYVALSAMPTLELPVTVEATSNDTAEGTIQPNNGSVSFNNGNWDIPQEIFINVENDGIADGDQNYNINLTVSGDPQFIPDSQPTVNVTNVDVGTALDPTVGLEVSPSITIAEGGRVDSISVRLTASPAVGTRVRLIITSDQPGQDNISETNPIFTELNWNNFQNISVTAVDDDILESLLTYDITVAIDSTWAARDIAYDNVPAQNVVVKNSDNDFPQIIIEPPTILTTYENSSEPTATFTVVLGSAPLAEAKLNFVSTAIDEGFFTAPTTDNRLQLTFDTTNWNVPQEVEIRGIEDDFYDGDVRYSIKADAPESGGILYTNIILPEIEIINTDDEIPGIITNVSNLTTNETGTTAAFDVTLTSPPEPGKVVTLQAFSGDISEGDVNPKTLIFNYDNYNTPQTVTVIGIDDATVDDDQTYDVVVSIDATASGNTQSAPYINSGVNARVTISNLDDDLISGVPQVILSKDQLSTREVGGPAGSDEFSIRLNTQPTATVTIDMIIGDSSEGIFNSGSNSTTVSFTQADWNINQLITISGVDDQDIDGLQTYQISFTVTSNDVNYNNMILNPIIVENQDNEELPGTPNLIVSNATLTTSEDATTDFFNVRLESAPAADIPITFIISDSTEGVFVQPSNSNPQIKTVIFTTANWNTLQAVAVQGVDDNEFDGNVTYTITVENHNHDITVINNDNDQNNSVPNLIIPKTSGTTNENGSTTTFTIALSSSPNTNLEITLNITEPNEGAFTEPSNNNPATKILTFTPSNWNEPQTIVVRGVDDSEDDGNKTYQITIDRYNDFLLITNDDNDQNVQTAEAGSMGWLYVCYLLIYLFYRRNKPATLRLK